MTRTRFLACALFAAALIQARTTHAQAHTALDDAYIAAKLTLGLGGSVDATVSNANDTVSATRNSSLGVAFGLAGEYVVPLHDYFALGGMLGLSSWRSSAGGDGDGGRNLLFDLAVLPKGKYAVNRELELYLAVPIGLSLDFLNEANNRNTLFATPQGTALVEYDGGSAFGFVIGFLFGARYALTHDVGLLAELGYMHHSFSHTVKANLSLPGVVNATAETDVSISFGQFALNLGAYF